MTALAERLDDRTPLAAPTEGPPRWRDAHLYLVDDELREALRVAITLRQPLLLTGHPGSGKTSAAYWAALRMGLAHGDLFAETIRSDATAARLRYEFDAVRYFRDAQANGARNVPWDENPRRYIREGVLWNAFAAARTRHVALLLDEIDKAPRDLPNDLLQEFDEFRFKVPELPAEHPDHVIDARSEGAKGSLALVVFTSNGMRPLPDAFLRRCVHHHVEFDRARLREIVVARITRGDIKLDGALVDLALDRFADLQQLQGLHHKPGLAEFLAWTRMIGLAGNLAPARLKDVKLAKLPYLGTLLKDPKDRDLVNAL